ncbi:hypothetical protein OTU49_009074 [Cherax quadricarinatus]|uniref:Ig-like domain-containing protein n=1 Tax=Cherax quadricarinatus TaxID=27406 RepID=A0AAW0WLI8_CHEQU|nr:uncharacterized protein LOC128700366 [Cherax quadricarinatus]
MRLLLGSLAVMVAATSPARGDTLPSLFLSSSGFSYKTSSFHSTFRQHPAPLVMKTARFVVVSEGQYDHDHHTHGREDHGREDHAPREPHFATGNTSAQVFLGNTVTLDCTIHDMTNESVSWMRRVDDMLELITWDSHTYAKDDRYSLVRESGDRWHRWQLVIRRTRIEDQGQYRCQVATQPPMVLVVTLNVTEPVARVVDERGTKVLEKHYNSGSMIELKCVIEKVPFPHGPVTWRRDATTLTYNTSRGGISVKGDAAAGYIRSRLYVADATPSDSGVYSCCYSNFTRDTVTVHVIAGENSAAMQHDALPGSTSSSRAPLPPTYLPYLSYVALLPSVCLAVGVLTPQVTRRELPYTWITFCSIITIGLFREAVCFLTSQSCHEDPWILTCSSEHRS